MPQHIPHTPRRSRHSRTARRDAETPVAVGTVAALSGHHRCRSTQQQSARCAAFRGFCGAGAPAPCTTCGGKDVRAHNASTAWSAGCRKGGTQLGIYASAFDRQTGQHISHHAVHSQHSSQQSSAVISHHHLSHLRLAAMFAHVMCMHCARGQAAQSWRGLPGPGSTVRFEVFDIRRPSARPEGHAPFCPRLIVGGDRSGNELTSYDDHPLG